MAFPLCYFLLLSSQTSCLFPCQQCEDTCLDWQMLPHFRAQGEHEPGPASAHAHSMRTFLSHNLSPSWVDAPWAKRWACWVSTLGQWSMFQVQVSWRRGYCQTFPATTAFLRKWQKFQWTTTRYLLRKKYIFLSIKVELYYFKIFTFLLITLFFLLLFGCTPVFIAKGIYY